MPKRILDGEGVWRSDKLARIDPPWIKAEFANLIPLARANGSFECNPRLVWTQVYAYNRPEITPEQVQQILAELERVKLLFRWTDEQGKTWGFWVGIKKAGRLPPTSRKDGKHEAIGPEPPSDLLRNFLGTESDGQPLDSHCVADGSLGLGSGFGKGYGPGDAYSSDAQNRENSVAFNPTEAAMGYCHAFSVVGEKNYDAVRQAIELEAKTSIESPQEIAQRMILARQSFNAIPKPHVDFDGGEVWFITSGRWKKPETWRKGVAAIPAPPKKDAKAEQARLQALEDKLKAEARARREDARNKGVGA